MDLAVVEQLGLDPTRTHVNHGAFGAVPVVVRAAQRRWQEQAEANPHRFNRVEVPGLVRTARDRAAEFLGVEPASAALVRNVSEGVSAVLAALDLGPGDEIVLNNHSYGAVRLAVEHHVARHGVLISDAVFGVEATDDEVVAAYAAAVSERTRLVVVDQITSPTARALPVAGVVAAAAARGVPVLVDAAHVPGSLATDIAALGATYWVGNLHKWAYASRGTALLWVAEPARDRLPPLVLSWHIGGDLGERFDLPGTWDFSPWLAMGEGLDFWAGLGGWDAVAECTRVAEAGQAVVADALGTSLEGFGGAWSPTMRLARLPADWSTGDGWVDALYERLSAEARIEVAPVAFGGAGYVRIAAAPYNTAEDYERLAAALVATG